jgi:hypothetical protein
LGPDPFGGSARPIMKGLTLPTPECGAIVALKTHQKGARTMIWIWLFAILYPIGLILVFQEHLNTVFAKIENSVLAGFRATNSNDDKLYSKNKALEERVKALEDIINERNSRYRQ